MAKVANAGALINGRQKRAAIILRAADARGRVERDKARQILVLGAQPVQQPRPEAWPHKLETTGVQLHKTLRMPRDIAIHAVEQAKLVRMLGELGIQFRYLDTALAALGKFPGRFHQLAAAIARGLLSIVTRQRRLVVKGVHVRGPTAHAGKNNTLGARLEVRLLRRKRITVGFGGHCA